MSVFIPQRHLSFLQAILSEAQVAKLLKTTTNPEELNLLLIIQSHRAGRSAKLELPIQFIFQENDDIDVETEIELLKNIIKITDNQTTLLIPHLNQLIFSIRSNDNMEEALLRKIKLLNCFFVDHLRKEVTLKLNLHDLLKIIDLNIKRVNNFIYATFLGNFLDADPNSLEVHVKTIFLYAKLSKNVQLLCSIHTKSDFLIFLDDYWLFLIDILTASSYVQQKQAIFLISKAVAKKSEKTPIYLETNGFSDETDRIWKNFFILLEASNEKQLHLVQPTLGLFDAIKPLHFKWKQCLYRIFLRHTQNSVVFYTGSHLLRLEWPQMAEIIPDFYRGVNQHEYSANSQLMFDDFGQFVSNFDKNQFVALIGHSLAISWTPVALWRVYSRIFQDGIDFDFSLTLLKSVFKMMHLLPNVCIRKGCLELVGQFVVRNFDGIVDLGDLFEIACVLDEMGKGLRGLFQQFIDKRRRKFVEIFREGNFEVYVKANCDVCMAIGSYLKIGDIDRIANFGEGREMDAIIAWCPDAFTKEFQQNYIDKRFRKLGNGDNLDYFLNLVAMTSYKSFEQHCHEILLDESTSKVQKIVAFNAISWSKPDNEIDIASKPVVDYFAEKIMRENQIYIEMIEPFIRLFKLLYLNPIYGEIGVDQLQKAAILFTKILEIDNEYLSYFYGVIDLFFSSEDLYAQSFSELCLKEFFRARFDESMSRVLLKHLIVDRILDNEATREKVFAFLDRLIKESSSSMADIILEAIERYCFVQRPFYVWDYFIPIICNFILHGSVVTRTERVDYAICKEIVKKCKFSNKIGHFFKVASIRHKAIEIMKHSVLAYEEDVTEEEYASKFIKVLISNYEKSFQKRYFPDSQLHLEKLRTIQALLILSEHISMEKDIFYELEEFALKCLLEESHQISVQHLLQLLNISIMSEYEFEQGFNCPILSRLKQFNETKPSSIVNLIVVLYHITIKRPVYFWYRVVQGLVPYTMGAQFKLRIYAQVALMKLFEKAEENKMRDFVAENKALYDSIKQVVDATSHTFKTFELLDRNFLEYVNYNGIVHEETVYYTIPKETGVMESEWEYSTYSLFAQFNESPKFSITQTQPIHENIQKKITPWRETFDDDQSTKNLILVTSLVEKASNLGGLSRSCEVFGVKKFITRTAQISSEKEFKSLSMSSEHWLDIMEVKISDLKEYFNEIRKKGYAIVGAEQTSDSIQLDKFQFPKFTVLVLGNEKEGISPDLIPLLDHCVEIPQIGLVRSLNVHVAGAIIMWEYCKQHLL